MVPFSQDWYSLDCGDGYATAGLKVMTKNLIVNRHEQVCLLDCNSENSTKLSGLYYHVLKIPQMAQFADLCSPQESVEVLFRKTTILGA